jgi:hypothetical protein
MKLRALVPICALSLAGASGAQEGVAFDPGCPLPFAEIAVEREIDALCGPQGTAKQTRSRIQNTVKNDFCAEGEPILLLNRNFKSLQKRIAFLKVRHGANKEPVDRTVFGAGFYSLDGLEIGEGSLVQHAGWIGSVDYLGEGRTESVNCGRDEESWKDIHLELAELIDSKRRERISTEISPHFRPDSWTPEVLGRVKALGLPVRVTGQLFFDGSHQLENYRASNWEIHPVYRIEVCSSGDLADCRDEVEGITWTDLHAWAGK